MSDRDYLTVIFHNITEGTIGIYFTGTLRNLSNKDTPNMVNQILYDTVFEIEQNNTLVRSTDIDFYWVQLDNRIPELYILNPDSIKKVELAYSGNLMNDFNLGKSPFQIRAIIDQSIDYLNEDSTILLQVKRYQNLIIIEDKIITPYVSIND